MAVNIKRESRSCRQSQQKTDYQNAANHFSPAATSVEGSLAALLVGDPTNVRSNNQTSRSVGQFSKSVRKRTRQNEVSVMFETLRFRAPIRFSRGLATFVAERGAIMNGRDISIAASDGGNFGGYLTQPKDAKAPGVVIIQEIFGVNDHIREVVDEYAAAGYLALAPDMFWRIEPNVRLGYSPGEVQKARAYRPKFNLDLGVHDIESTIKTMRAMPQCDGKVAVVGYCFGGLMAYLTAARTDVAAASCYYGGGIDTFIAEASAVKGPIQFHFGAKDAAIPVEVWDKVRCAFAGRNDAEVFAYEGAEHGFNCTRRASFHPEASKLARSRTLDLLHRTIGPRA